MKKTEDKKKQERYNYLSIDGTKYRTLLTDKYKNREKWVPPDKKCVCAFIPGTIVKICVKPNQEVREGDNLFILEAMKMKNHVLSPVNGKIKSITVKSGDVVERQQLVLTLE